MLLLAGLVVLVAAAIVSPLRSIVRGWIAGESFYRLRPTSYWISLLSSDDSVVRQEAVTALKLIGPNAEAAVPSLTKALEDRSEQVRWKAANALGEIGRRPEEAVPALVRMLSSKDSADRRWATVGLGRLGPDAVAAVPALIERLDDRVPFVRGDAACALGRIGPGAKAAVPKLLEKRDDDSEFYGKPYLNTVGEMACAALWEIDPKEAEEAGVPPVFYPWRKPGEGERR